MTTKTGFARDFQRIYDDDWRGYCGLLGDDAVCHDRDCRDCPINLRRLEYVWKLEDRGLW